MPVLHVLFVYLCILVLNTIMMLNSRQSLDYTTEWKSLLQDNITSCVAGAFAIFFSSISTTASLLVPFSPFPLTRHSGDFSRFCQSSKFRLHSPIPFSPTFRLKDKSKGEHHICFIFLIIIIHGGWWLRELNPSPTAAFLESDNFFSCWCLPETDVCRGCAFRPSAQAHSLESAGQRGDSLNITGKQKRAKKEK